MLAAAANAAWLTSAIPRALAFRRACADPAATQEAVLLRIVRRNAATEFGRAHDFSSIVDAAGYRARVPACDHEDLREAIERISSGAANVLTAAPVVRFIPTSGTTSGSKLIPYTRELLTDFDRAIAPWIVSLFASDPLLASGGAYWSVSPLLDGPQHTPAGIPIGFTSDDEYLGALQRRLVRAVQVVPESVARLGDVDAFRYATLFHLLSRPDLRLISIWNPTFLSLLVEPLERWGLQLAEDVERGTAWTVDEWTMDKVDPVDEVDMDGVPAARRTKTDSPSMSTGSTSSTGSIVHSSTVHASFHASRARAAAIRRALTLDRAARHRALWPKLRLISCWADAAAAPESARIAQLFPQARIQPKGLVSTEGFVSIPVESGAVLAVRSHFFEFLDCESGDMLSADEVRQGRRYEVVLTTSGGLYRYRTGDEIEITGRFANTPMLRFLGRGGKVSDHYGEKLSEAHVAAAIDRVIRTRARFAMLAFEKDSYALFIESDLQEGAVSDVTAALEAELLTNPHYAYCRRLGQLGPLRAFVIRGNGSEQYLTGCASRGQKLGEIKPVSLHRGDGWSEAFEGKWLACR